MGRKRRLTFSDRLENIDEMKMPASFSYVALLALELGYTFFLFDAGTSKVQAGLMLIFALEVAFAVRVAKVQLYLKQIDRALVIRSRAYAAAYVIGMAVAMVIGVGMFPFSGVRWVMAAAFIAVASAKVMWERHFAPYAAASAASGR